MKKSITVIPATKNKFTSIPTTSVTKRKVAAYARVSTDSDEQFTSYEAQIDYYTKFINRREDWQFVKVYTDEGISGTNTKNRNGFNEMIQDALGGKIDLIVTKSVSRFARNTVDSLVTVRKLKESGTEVFFEKENIYTFDSKGELLITIMSSLAQEESRSLSENVTWGQRKRFSDGKVQMNYTRFLGYEKGADGKPVINEKEAQTVRLIYRLFMEGKTPCGICRELEKLGILTVSGKQKWSASTVRSILTNERYKGDALLQKKFTVDFLTKKMKVNEGEVPQYYVEDSHPAIITKREFDIVQAEIARRKKLGSSYSGNDIFSSKIVCADCGGFYGSKLWHSKDKYKCTIYQCNNKFKNAEKCKTPNLTADDIRNAFIKAYNIVMADRTTVLEDCKIMIDTVCNSTKLNEEIDALTAELKVVSELVSECVNENAQKKQSQDAYTKKYNSLVRRYERAEKHLNKATAEREDKVNKEHELRLFFETLKNKPQLIDTWDENLWITLVEKIEVSHDKMCTVFFKNGVSVKVDI